MSEEQEAEEKANRAKEMNHRLAEQNASVFETWLNDHRLAEQNASAFEAWLNDHRDATKEEAHKRLTDIYRYY